MFDASWIYMFSEMVFNFTHASNLQTSLGSNTSWICNPNNNQIQFGSYSIYTWGTPFQGYDASQVCTYSDYGT